MFSAVKIEFAPAMKIFHLLILITCWMGNDAWGVAKSGELSTTINRVNFAFVQIRPGKFMMGTEKIVGAEKPKHIDPMPVHRVKISKPFQIGKYEVTMEQWDALMENNPAVEKARERICPSIV